MSTNAFEAVGKWGPLVIGEERYKAEKEIKRIGAHKWGPLVTGASVNVAAAGGPRIGKVAPRTYNEMRAKAAELGLTFEGTPSKEVLAAALAAKGV